MSKKRKLKRFLKHEAKSFWGRPEEIRADAIGSQASADDARGG